MTKNNWNRRARNRSWPTGSRIWQFVSICHVWICKCNKFKFDSWLSTQSASEITGCHFVPHIQFTLETMDSTVMTFMSLSENQVSLHAHPQIIIIPNYQFWQFLGYTGYTIFSDPATGHVLPGPKIISHINLHLPYHSLYQALRRFFALSLKPISSPTMPAFLLWSPGSNWWGSRANTPEISWNGPRPYRNEGFLKWRYPQIIQSRPFSYENHLKPMVLGIHFRKPPNGPKDVFVFPMKPWFRFLQWGMRCIVSINLVGGLEHFLFFQILGIIIPTDFHIFQRGRYTTNQKMWGWLHTIPHISPL